MTQAIISSLPVTSRWIPSCLENIMDKKVNQAALNFFEKLIDCLCTWFFCPYGHLYQAKLARVHTFSDKEAKLFDATMQGIAKVEQEGKTDFISVNNRKIHFHPTIEIEFSRRAFTDYVIVKDDEKRRPGWFQIIEQESPRPGNPKPMEKNWLVNTNHFEPKVVAMAAG